MSRKKKKTTTTDSPARPKKKKSFAQKHLSTIIMLLFLMAGAGIMSYPSFSNWWNERHASQAISAYAEVVAETDESELEAMLAEADEFNRKLASYGSSLSSLSSDMLEEYYSLLDLNGTGVIGYIQIPSIDVDLPIYHGTSEAVLQVAAGHLEGSSFPIGGESTHACISGHRGLPSAKLFTDLDELKEGDVFMITVLNRTVTYQIDQIRIVLPEDTSDLQIFSGGDYVTLITCTPYGVNTHRMLVRGTRIDNIEGYLAVAAEAIKIPTAVVAVIVFIPLMLLVLIGMLIVMIIKKPDPTIREQMEFVSEWCMREDPMKKQKHRSGKRKNSL